MDKTKIRSSKNIKVEQIIKLIHANFLFSLLRETPINPKINPIIIAIKANKYNITAKVTNKIIINEEIIEAQNKSPEANKIETRQAIVQIKATSPFKLLLISFLDLILLITFFLKIECFLFFELTLLLELVLSKGIELALIFEN